MKKIYKITGMTCNGCRSQVEKILNGLESVTSATVNLEQSEAIIDASPLPDLQTLQAALPEKYTIQEQTQHVFTQVETTEEKSELQQLFPLFLIFLYITTATVLMNLNDWSVSEFMLDFMGLFYVVFSFFKFLDYTGFPKSFQMYDPLAKQIPAYAWIYPFIEITLGIFFLFRFQIPMALIVTIIILGITTIGVTKALFDKKAIQCACLGTALKLPMTKATFIENSIMLVMAVWMLVKLYS
ncbi:cation transporter [Kordia sp. YSTF-M3]|uniref:Cation transporter n=1 Tax=Kordia aestuariivivens TaxID=2759037 RepID=A0ABR7QEW4_9FLAO|nr:heavy metal-associated domain-containing protein [Kordia aestuariivivens]MBC8757105.1 cation transporter [Kordia aestuariivivens]